MKYYITTSIAYTNAFPHIGFALESVQADVLARYHRAKNEDVFFLTGTDEHGVKIQKAAKAAGKNPQEFVDEISNEFKDLKKSLNLSWDYFIRTTDQKQHWPGVFEMWKLLESKGVIYKKKYDGLYCGGCEAFKTAKDLVEGKCPDHLIEPEKVEEENYFFKLSDYSEEIERKIKSNELRIIPETRKNEILSFLSQKLNDISISRPKEKLSWGIPVPGDDSQVIYVWADALTNYISALGFGLENKDNFEIYWVSGDSEKIHFVGKDILRFHAVIWPGMLLAAGLPLPDSIFAHGFVTSNGQKMSKSLGNVVSPAELVKKYGIDAVRYYLLREIPAYGDGDFSFEKFEERYNGELANGLGNFAARVLTLASRARKDAEEKNAERREKNTGINKKIEETKKIVEQKIEEFKFNEAIGAIWELISFGDNYVNQTKPWESPETKKEILADLVLILENVSKMTIPFLPETSEKILNAIKENKKPETLFPRIK